MINAAVVDFGVLDYSPTSAGAVLDTLALLSSNMDALGTESQVSSYISKVCRLPQNGPSTKNEPRARHLSTAFIMRMLAR